MTQEEQDQKRLEFFVALTERNFTNEELGLTLVGVFDMFAPDMNIEQFNNYLDYIKKEYAIISKQFANEQNMN